MLPFCLPTCHGLPRGMWMCRNYKQCDFEVVFVSGVGWRGGRVQTETSRDKEKSQLMIVYNRSVTWRMSTHWESTRASPLSLHPVRLSQTPSTTSCVPPLSRSSGTSGSLASATFSMLSTPTHKRWAFDLYAEFRVSGHCSFAVSPTKVQIRTLSFLWAELNKAWDTCQQQRALLGVSSDDSSCSIQKRKYAIFIPISSFQYYIIKVNAVTYRKESICNFYPDLIVSVLYHQGQCCYIQKRKYMQFLSLSHCFSTISSRSMPDCRAVPPWPAKRQATPWPMWPPSWLLASHCLSCETQWLAQPLPASSPVLTTASSRCRAGTSASSRESPPR